MEYQIAYLDIYGNAGILAEEISGILHGAELVNLSKQEISDDANSYLLVFEITQNAIPLKIMDILENLEGKTILCCVIPSSVMDTIQEALDENPENKQAQAMLEAFQHAKNHPDAGDFRELRRFIQESGI